MSPAAEKSLMVHIADKVFKIKIDPEKEVFFLETLQTVNAKIKDFKASYPGLYLQEYLSMALIWMTSELIEKTRKEQEAANSQESVIEKINQWEVLLKNVL